MVIIHDAHTTFLNQLALTADRTTLISVGLLIETHARIFERFGGVTLNERDQSLCADALRNVLDALGVRDDVLDEYARQVESHRNATASRSPDVGDVPSVGLASWRSRTDDAAALAQREGAQLLVSPSSPSVDRPLEPESSRSDASWPGEDKTTEMPALDAWPGESSVRSDPTVAGGYTYPSEIEPRYAEFDADVGTLGEE